VSRKWKVRATRITVGATVFHLGVSLIKLLFRCELYLPNRLLLALKCVKTEEVLQKWIRALGFLQSLLSFRSLQKSFAGCGINSEVAGQGFVHYLQFRRKHPRNSQTYEVAAIRP